MTECERIIQQGILPKSFFEEEVRCGFLVTEKRKKIWAVLLDLLLKFDEVCKKYGLKYYLTDGTLLGAVRHKGFIPWDDDIDVSMPRDDYERLQTLASEFSFPYFLQTPYTDKNYFYSFVKIRNSNTTGLSKAFRYQGFNDGLVLDVFPLDEVNPEQGETIYERIRQLAVGNSAYMKLSNPNYSEEEMAEIRKIANKNPLQAYDEIHRLATMFNGSNQTYISHWVTTIEPYNRRLWPKCLFADILNFVFEGFAFPGPIGYDEYLKICYGDYMRFPPVEKRGVQHDNAIFDPDKPYSFYYLKNRI